MEKNKRKQITFDLHTNKMQELGINRSTGYNQIRAELKKRGIEHLQGSVYVSLQGMTNNHALGIFAAIGEKCPWLDACINKLSITTAPKNLDYADAYREARAIVKAEAAKQTETTQKEEAKQPSHADQVLWVLENCGERIAEDIAANKSRQSQQVGNARQAKQVQQVRQGGQGKSAASRKVRSK